MTTSHFLNQTLGLEDKSHFTDAEVDAIRDELTKEAAAPLTPAKQREETEHAMVKSFLKAPSQTTFMPLYTAFKPMIRHAASAHMYGSPLPAAAHEMYAAQSFLDATRTWNPSKGRFATHAYTTVHEKGKRLNPKYQNIGYIPEARAMKYQAYNSALHIMREDLGREPSTLELSDYMSMAPADIERMRKEVRKDLLMNDQIPMQGPAFAQSDKTMQMLRDIQYELTPKHQAILDHLVGLNGSQALTKKSGGPDVSAVARAARVSVNDVRSAQKTISRKIKAYRGLSGQSDQLNAFFESEG